MGDNAQMQASKTGLRFVIKLQVMVRVWTLVQSQGQF